MRGKQGGNLEVNVQVAQEAYLSHGLLQKLSIALKSYLEERERSGEKVTKDSPLFTDAFNKGTFITIDAYGRVWTRLLLRSGLAKKSTNWHELHIHTLRKYFRSNCIGVDASYREMWMGHKGQYLDMSYFRAEEQRHLDEYRKVVQYLTIQEPKKDNSI